MSSTPKKTLACWLFTLLILAQPSCCTVNDMAAKPNGGNGASEDEVIIITAGALILDFCIIFAACHQRRHDR